MNTWSAIPRQRLQLQLYWLTKIASELPFLKIYLGAYSAAQEQPQLEPPGASLRLLGMLKPLILRFFVFIVISYVSHLCVMLLPILCAKEHEHRPFKKKSAVEYRTPH